MVAGCSNSDAEECAFATKRIAITEFHHPIKLSINPLTLTCNLGDNPDVGKLACVDTTQHSSTGLVMVVFSAAARRHEVAPRLPGRG
jgi:hypothetical protein